MSSTKEESASKKAPWKIKFTNSKKKSKEESEVSESEEEEKVKQIKDKKRKTGQASDPLAIVNCTACARQINPARDSVLRKHPDLSVLICKKCWSFYHSGEVTKDEDGLDEQCRWCGEGGKLIGCDYCHNVFCKSCILRNFGRAELSVILDDSDDNAKWKCYVCDKDKLNPLVNHCDELFKKVAEDRKSREAAAATRDPKKSNGVEKRSTSANNGNELEFKINPSDLTETVTRLNLTTGCFQSVLNAVSLNLKHENEDSEASSSSVDMETKLRSAKTLTKGLKSYLKSLNEIIKPQNKSHSQSKKKKSSKIKPLKVNLSDLSDYSDVSSDSSKCKNQKNLKSAVSKLTVKSCKPNPSLLSSDEASNTIKNNKEPKIAAGNDVSDDDVSSINQISITSSDDDKSLFKTNVEPLIKKTSISSIDKRISDDGKLSNGNGTSICDNISDDESLLKSKTSSDCDEPSIKKKSKSSIDDKVFDDEEPSVKKESTSNPDSVKKYKTDMSQKCSNEETFGEDTETDIKHSEKKSRKKSVHKKLTYKKKEGRDSCLDENNDKNSDMKIYLKTQESNDDDDDGDDDDDDDIKMGGDAKERKRKRGKDDSSDFSVKMSKKKQKSKDMEKADNNENQEQESIFEGGENLECNLEEITEKIPTEDLFPGKKKDFYISDISSDDEKSVTENSKLNPHKNVHALSENDNENKAAQLDLLKELEDELCFEKDKTSDCASETDVKGGDISLFDEGVDVDASSDDSDMENYFQEEIKNDDDTDSSLTDAKNKTEKSRPDKKLKSKSTEKLKGKKVEKFKTKKTVEREEIKAETSKDYNGYYNDDDISSSDLIMSSSSGDDFIPEKSRKRVRVTKKVKAGNKSMTNCGSESESDSDFDYKKSKRDLRKDLKAEKESKKKVKERRKAKKEADDDDSDSDKSQKDKKGNGKKKTAESDSEESQSSKKGMKNGKDAKKSKKKGDKSESEDSDLTENGKKSARNVRDKKKSDSDDSDDLGKEIDKLEKGNETLEKKAKKKKNNDNEEEEEKDDKKKDKCKKENGKKSKGKSKSKGTGESSSSDDGKADKDQSDEDSDDEVTIKKCLPMPKLEGESQDENEQAKKDLLADLDDDDDGDESSTVDEDSDDAPKKKTGKKNKSKAKTVKEEDCSDSDFEPVKKKRVRSSLLDEKISESDSDEDKPKNKRKQKGGSDEDFDPEDDSDDSGVIKKKRKKKKKSSSSEEENTDTDEDNKKKKRKRIKRPKNSSDEGAEEDDDDEKDSPTKGGRKKIRKVMSDKKVTDETKAAAKAEEERRRRVAELQKKFNIVTVEDESSLTKCPITTKLVLESDKEGNPLVEVVKYLIKKLKPHQVEAVQFMWSCCIESLKRLKKEEGSGCILAHCMGLGKTLSVVSFIHTVISASEYTNMHTCLIVSPLNTVLNWRNECSMWLREKDRMDIYELSSVKDNHARSRYLREWQRDGGILIIGYEMYRNLTNTGRVRNKKLRKVFEETLVNPGPDLVVCDEGHILKNEQSAISQAMNKIKTKRRIVLTGTPLQNNLNEYHCMLSFVKPKLLGTRKEFLNRFVNPITNGQCSDSTQHDVRVMKRRAHVLHEMLAGCVQRKDYSALTKFLPPKLEYVISVRLAPVQMTLYEKYLETSGQGVGGTIITRGGRLFQDYQALSKIWTHPWVLKLSEIRQEAKAKYDEEEEEEDELSNDSFIDDSTSDEGSTSTDDKSDDSIIMKGDSDSDVPRTRRTRGAVKKDSKNKKQKEEQPSTSKGKTEEKDEVVNTWKTRSRGGGGDNDKLLPGLNEPETPGPISNEWWAEYLKEEDKYRLELSGKLTLLFKILQMCEEIGDKVLVFSQSLLSLDIIEDFLDSIDRKFQEEAETKTEEEKVNTFGKCWTKGADYFRMDGSTSVSLRQSWAEHFNNPENYRARLFVISTKAGGLGINLVGANRAIIFDASWNPSHDIQSIFRVYRFGQVKPVYIYRFLAQGTMEEKIYERQVTKQSLSQRVVDEHQIERHFTSSDLQALYAFTPDRLDDPNHVEKTPVLPKDTLLAELLKNQKEWIVSYHEHDSLLENKVDETLTEEERKSAWEEYEVDKDRQPVVNRAPMMNPMYSSMMGGASYNPQMNSIQQRAFSAENVSQVVQLVRSKFPQLTGDMFQAQVQNIIMQQIIQYQQQQEQEIAARQRQEMERLRMIQSQVASREKQYNQANAFGVQPWAGAGNKLNYTSLLGQPARPTMASSNMESIIRDSLTTKPTEKTPSKNPPTVVDLSKS
ncbi:hypothetical protein SNE40_016493 [Patella caerulea]|uniref:ATP-dependent helicase ATRX n=1 Tax=Patella caerulea TaxID=87958 RepID=A0AAN8JEA1_PATCE